MTKTTSIATPQSTTKPIGAKAGVKENNFLDEIAKSIAPTTLKPSFEELVNTVKAPLPREISHKQDDTPSSSKKSQPKEISALPREKNPRIDTESAPSADKKVESALNKERDSGEMQKEKEMLPAHETAPHMSLMHLPLIPVTPLPATPYVAVVAPSKQLTIPAQPELINAEKTSLVTGDLAQPELKDQDTVRIEILKDPITFTKTQLDKPATTVMAQKVSTQGESSLQPGDNLQSLSDKPTTRFNSSISKTGMQALPLQHTERQTSPTSLIFNQMHTQPIGVMQVTAQKQSGDIFSKIDPPPQGIAGRSDSLFQNGRASLTAQKAVNQADKILAIQELKKQIKTFLQKGETHMVVHLKPNELGAVDIKVDITRDGKAAVFFKAEQRETMELLTQHAHEFQQAFQESGLSADMAGMNFSSAQHQFSEMLAKTEPGEPLLESSDNESNLIKTTAIATAANGIDIHV